MMESTVQQASPQLALPASTADAHMTETLPHCSAADIHEKKTSSIITESEEPVAEVAASPSKIQAAPATPLQHAGVAIAAGV